jgi:hypothetical protein
MVKLLLHDGKYTYPIAEIVQDRMPDFCVGDTGRIHLAISGLASQSISYVDL